MPFFVSDLCVAIICKDFQSSEDIFLLDSHSRDSSGGVCNQGTSIFRRFTCIEATIKYIFDMYAQNFQAEPYKIQHGVIPLNFEKKKKRKNIVQNLLTRSREMKVPIKPVFEDKNRENNSLHFVQGSFHQGNVLLFPTTAGEFAKLRACRNP